MRCNLRRKDRIKGSPACCLPKHLSFKELFCGGMRLREFLNGPTSSDKGFKSFLITFKGIYLLVTMESSSKISIDEVFRLTWNILPLAAPVQTLVVKHVSTECFTYSMKDLFCKNFLQTDERVHSSLVG